MFGQNHVELEGTLSCINSGILSTLGKLKKHIIHLLKRLKINSKHFHELKNEIVHLFFFLSQSPNIFNSPNY